MDIESEKQQMVWEDSPENMQIDPRRARFPFCIVWTPLPVLSWLIPFIGHIGICREDGVILDFAGPNFVCVDNFAFGAAARYLQIDVAKQCYAFNQLNNQQDKNQPEKDPLTWDEALRKSTQEFQHRSYNLLTCNCHSFVANAANRLGFCGGKWNVVSLAVLILLKGQWVSKAAILRSYLPFIIVSAIGVGLGGWSFVEFWCVLLLVLVGWFVVGSYCFKNLIHL